jgi:hypothetical protein
MTQLRLASSKTRHDCWCFGVIIIAFFAIGLTAVCQPESPIETDICSISKQPKHYNKKRVRLRGQVEASMHGYAIFDSGCKSGIRFRPSNVATEDPGIKALDDAIYRQGSIGTIGNTIIVALTGEFLRHSKDNPDFLLIIDKAEDLDVKLKEP